MAPKRKKDEKDTPDSGSALILEYLKKQNRPYSALDISTNLHGKVTKAFAVKALKEMHERKEIEGRAAGKQIVYHAIQQIQPDESTSPNSNDLGQSNKDLQEQISALKVREKDIRERLATINAVVPLSVLREQVTNLEEKKNSLNSQISKLNTDLIEAGSPNTRVCKDDIDQINLDWQKWKTQVASQKKIFLEFWTRCTEVLPPDTTEADLKEMLGVEGDF